MRRFIVSGNSAIGTAGRIGFDRRLERTEAAAKGHLLLIVEILVAEKDQRIFFKSSTDFREPAVIGQAADIDFGNLSPE
jgi:hypothetical protein